MNRFTCVHGPISHTQPANLVLASFPVLQYVLIVYCRRPQLASFPGSPEREINTRGEPARPDIFSHVIKIGPEFSEQKGNILRVIQPALRSTLGVYDIRPPIVIYM